MDCRKLIEYRKKLWDKTGDIEKDLDLRKTIHKEVVSSKQLTKEVLDNPHLLIELQFTVVDKEFTERPFFLNEVQRDFQDNTLIPMIEEQKKGLRDQIKIKILKGRQQGFSTYITAFQECLAITQKNFAGFTMAHDTDSTKSIFQDIAKGIFDNLYSKIKPKVQNSNAKELIFEKLKSSWRVSTAGAKGAGRGKKLRFLHNSEKAFWKDMRKNELAISQALTPTGSIEIDETTANGFNEFQEDWEEIEEGFSKWTGVFYEWWRTSEYRKKFNDVAYTEEDFLDAIRTGVRFNGVDSKFILKLAGLLKNGLDIYQLHWYFDKRKELKDKISQEYPCTPKEAFLHSGRPYFDIELLDIQIQELKNLVFESLHGGEIEVFKKPVKGRKYIMGSDVAEGLDLKDSSTFVILDFETMEEVANGEYTRKPEQHARILDTWGRLYNNAYIGVERNNHGHSTINTLRNECKYKKKRMHTETSIDTKTDKKTKKYGWLTSEKSKYLLLDELDSAHREGNIKINSSKTLNEMRGIQSEDGKVKTNGKDRIMALGIAYQMRKYFKSTVLIADPVGA